MLQRAPQSVHLIEKYAEARMELQRLANDMLAQTGFTAPQAVAIYFLRQNPGCSQTDLVKKSHIDRSTLADVVARLVEKNIIQRQYSAEDGRTYILHLTKDGEEAYRKILRAR